MRHTTRSLVVLTALLLAMSAALLGCPKEPGLAPAPPAAVAPAAPAAPSPAPTPGRPQVVEQPVTRPSPPVATPVPPAPVAPAPAAPAAGPLKDVFFDFDKANIQDDQRAALVEDVAWLKANGRAKITVEGHCDERGTAEYNLGLGERRAKAVKDYLVAAGIAADRIATISYGKERPFVLGHDESAWKWNRRGHFVITGR